MLLEGRLEQLSTARSAALQRHLASCRNCDGAATHERQLGAELRRLGRRLPFEIDVVSTVLSRIRRHDRDELTTRQLGWAAFITVCGSVCLLAALVGLWPNMTRSVQGIVVLAASLITVTFKLISPLASLVSGFIRSLESLGPVTARQLESTLHNLVPLGLAFVVAGILAMLATITLVLVHEFRRPVETCLGEDR
jgi:hypothetical protein